MSTAPTISEPLFYCATLPQTGDAILHGGEAHHVTVQRLRRGDPIALFNGDGGAARGVVAAITGKEVHIAVRERMQMPPRRPRLGLYSAVPKGERMHMLLDMATQLGMSSFTAVRWRRNVVEPGARAQERWTRICIEACKQSRQLRVPALTSEPQTVEVAATRIRAAGARLIVAHPSTSAATALTMNVSGEDVALFVGPEGGITTEEEEALHAYGAQFVHLGDSVLRIETAALALLAIASGIRETLAAPSRER